MMTLLWAILIGAIVLYAGIVLLLYIKQDRLLYHPWRTMDDSPPDIGLPCEEQSILTSDGLKLHAWFIPHSEAKHTVLFCHGNAGNISHWLDTLAFYHAMKLQVLIFDYRGYGRSEGRPSEEGLYLDTAAAWHFLTHKKGIASDTIIIIGRSLGAAVAARQAASKKPGALVLESAFSSLPELAQELYPFFPAKLLSRARYPTTEQLALVVCPVLVVHSPEDETIPLSHGKRLFAAARGEKNFLELSGSHNDCYFNSSESYRQGLNDFIASSLHREAQETSRDNSVSNPR